MLDIWTPQLPDAQLHKNFKTLQKLNQQAVLAEIRRWTTGFVDRDNKIVKEFQSTFNSSFWEFYLNAALSELGFTINYAYDRPDFIDDARKVVIEAVIASHGRGAPAEWERTAANMQVADEQIEQFVNDACVRFSAKFLDKLKLYRESYSRLTHVKGKAYGIAIHPFDSPAFWVASESPPLAMLYSFKKDKGRELRDGFWQSTGYERMEEVVKPNQTILPTGYFLDDDCKEVSFVMYSTVATHSKATGIVQKDASYAGVVQTVRYNMGGTEPTVSVVKMEDYREGLLEGIRIYHNPFASTPVPTEFFDRPGVAQYVYDVERERIMKIGYHHGMLLQKRLVGAMFVPSDEG